MTVTPNDVPNRTPAPRTLYPASPIARPMLFDSVAGTHAIHLGFGTKNIYLSFEDAEELSEQLITALNKLESRQP